MNTEEPVINPTKAGSSDQERISSILKNLNLNPENSDNVRSALEMFARHGEIGRALAHAYIVAIEKEPTIARVEIELKEVSDYREIGGVVRHQEQTKTDKPKVVLMFGRDKALLLEFMQQHRTSIQINADQLGIAAEEMTPEQVAQFSMLHELGHAYDFLHHETRYETYEQKRMAEEKQKPGGSYPPEVLVSLVQLRPDQFPELAKQLYQLGQDPLAALHEIQERAYRARPTEQVADQFAVRVMKECNLLK